MFFNVFLVTDSGDKPYFLIGEGFSALFEHVGVSDVKAIEDSVSVDPEYFVSHEYKLL
jgi:hypothetical protein